MDGKIELTVVRTEGIDEDLSTLGCYITVDDELIDVITPLTLHSRETCILPMHGALRLIIKRMTQEDVVVGNVYLLIELLATDGLQ